MALTPMDLVIKIKDEIVEIHLDDVDLAAGPVLIDVREPQEAAQGMLPNAINIPRGVLEFQIHTHPELKSDSHPVHEHADKEIILYCQSGGRSALAAHALQSMGFSNIKSLAGGYLAWQGKQQA